MKVTKILLITILLSCISTFIAFAEQGWVQLATGGWQYYKEDGTRAENEWLNIDGNWYYFTIGRMRLDNDFVYSNINGNPVPEYYADENGIIVTNQWVTFLDKHYYAGADGKILRGTYTPDGYYVDYLGAWDQSVPKEDTESSNESDGDGDNSTKWNSIEEMEASIRLSDEEKQKAWNEVKKEAKSRLKYPNTSKFPEWDDEGITYFRMEEDNLVSVRGWCEAKNKMGNYVEVSISAYLYADTLKLKNNLITLNN